jgi:ribosomal 30S subunit maturation factor RimM
MRVVSTAGAEIGKVTTFHELPQGIMLDVATPRGSVVIPYRPEIVVRTDIETRTIVMDDRLGFLDDASGFIE